MSMQPGLLEPMRLVMQKERLILLMLGVHVGFVIFKNIYIIGAPNCNPLNWYDWSLETYCGKIQTEK